MQKQKFYRLAGFLAMVTLLQFAFVVSSNAQDSEELKPEMKVVDIELGNRESAEKFLSNGYHPKVEEDGRASYYFYNEWGSQVMKLTAPSVEDKYFITEIEVYRVSEKYRDRHYQAKEIKYFQTENGIFIGFKQSAMYFFAGIKNAGSLNIVKPKNLVKIKGEPHVRNKADKKYETLIYKIPNIKLSDGKTDASYEASYEFYKDTLKRFTLKIVPDEKNLAKEKEEKQKSDS